MSNLRNSSLWRRALSTLLLFGFAFAVVCAQERTITGQVTAQSEGPLAGVNIVLQGTTVGTQTDANGNYSIKVPGPDAVLVFSFISFTTQSVTVGSMGKIDVVLVPSTSTLSEVVVVGYGTQKRNEITSSVANVKADQFNKGSISSPEQLIQGKVAGLSITKPGSDPNGSYEIRLRGLNTVSLGTAPLVVIDGIIGGSLSNVDPNDIESMNVLKDASAAAIYGTRGAAGVILVTTKKGKKGTTTVEYNGYVTAETVAKFVNVMNAAEWRKLSAEVGKGTDFGFNTNWFDETTQTGITQVHNISMAGGTDKSTYRASFNYHDAQGIQITTGYKQLNGRINFTQKALNDKLTLEMNLGATKKNASYGFTDAFRYATIFNPTAPITSDDPGMKQFSGYFQQVGLFDYYNPVAMLKQNVNEGQDDMLNASLKGTFQITSGLAIDAFYSMQSSSNLRGRYYSKYDFWQGRNQNGLAQRSEDVSSNQLFESTIHWTGDVTNGVNLTALGGYSYQDYVYEGFYMSGGDFLTDAFTYNNMGASQKFKNGLGTVSSYKNSNKLIAFFGRVNLNVNNTYFLMASARYEGSSKFGSGNKWGVFPSVSAGVDISKFLQLSFIDELKVRASYGVTGNQPGSSYISLLRFGPSGSFYSNGSFLPAYAPVSNANPDLKWERNGEFDAGFDFAIFKSKLSGSFDFYTRTTNDLLWYYDVPSPPNLYTKAWLNLGKIKSSGLELTLNYQVLSKSDFNYNITLTPSYSLENTLVSLSGTYKGADLHFGVQDIGDMGSPGQNNTPMARIEEGKPIGQLIGWVYQGIDATGNRILLNVNGDSVSGKPNIDGADRQIIGNGLPKFLIGFGNTVTYKNWDLNVFFRGVFGHDLVNTYRSFYEVPSMIGSYNLPKTTADQRNPETGNLLNSTNGVLCDYYVEKASFVSLDNLALGYNFNVPKTWAFSKIRVYVAGNRLFTITKYTGVDPEPRYRDSESGDILQPGIDRRNTWFRTRSFTIGANIVF